MAGLSAGEMEFYLEESLDRSAGMGEEQSVSPPPAAQVNQWKKSGRQRLTVMKGMKESLQTLGKDMNG